MSWAQRCADSLRVDSSPKRQTSEGRVRKCFPAQASIHSTASPCIAPQRAGPLATTDKSVKRQTAEARGFCRPRASQKRCEMLILSQARQGGRLVTAEPFLKQQMVERRGLCKAPAPHRTCCPLILSQRRSALLPE